MRNLLEVFSGEMMRQVTIEKEMEVIYKCHDILVELSTLPVKPKEEKLNLGEILSTSFELILTLVDFNCDDIRGLFRDELFCYFFSLFKRFIDDIKTDFRSRILHLSEMVIEQIFENSDPSEFKATHPLSIPDT